MKRTSRQLDLSAPNPLPRLLASAVLAWLAAAAVLSTTVAVTVAFGMEGHGAHALVSLALGSAAFYVCQRDGFRQTDVYAITRRLQRQREQRKLVETLVAQVNLPRTVEYIGRHAVDTPTSVVRSVPIRRDAAWRPVLIRGGAR
jgi:hypothetical protein